MVGIVIIGAGECGVRAAFALREIGHAGQITLVGAEHHLPYERPPLSKGQAKHPKRIADEAAYREAEIDLVLGETIVSITRDAGTIACASGRTISYDQLLFTTGARARVLPGMEGLYTLRTLDDAQAIFGPAVSRTHSIIIGGGLIGLECAATLRGLGASVTVIEAADRLMGRAVPAQIAALLERRHREEGVSVLLGETIIEADPGGVVLAEGASGPRRRIAADRVIAGVGAVANCDVAEVCGLEVENGILVDERFRTSDLRIFAAGDCCRFPYRGELVRLESWRAAQDQAKHVVGAMLGASEPYTGIPWFWSDQYDLTLQIAGLPDPHAPLLARETGNETLLLFQLDKSGCLAAASGISRGNAIARDIKIAEKIIEGNRPVDPQRLGDPGVKLKGLLGPVTQTLSSKHS